MNKPFYATRIGHLAAAAPWLVEMTEDRGLVMVVPEGAKVNQAMRTAQSLTWDWTIENRGEIVPVDWEQLPEVTND